MMQGQPTVPSLSTTGLSITNDKLIITIKHADGVWSRGKDMPRRFVSHGPVRLLKIAIERFETANKLPVQRKEQFDRTRTLQE